MNRSATLLLRAVLVLVGIGALGFLIWEPQVEGRNAHATLFAIYFNDPFLAYAYVGSVPFFVGLYQAFKVLGNVARDGPHSPSTARALRTIRYCALAVIGFVAVGEVFIILDDSDDRAGGVFMGVLVSFFSLVVAATMAVLERRLHNGAAMRASN